MIYQVYQAGKGNSGVRSRIVGIDTEDLGEIISALLYFLDGEPRDKFPRASALLDQINEKFKPGDLRAILSEYNHKRRKHD